MRQVYIECMCVVAVVGWILYFHHFYPRKQLHPKYLNLLDVVATHFALAHQGSSLGPEAVLKVIIIVDTR